MSHADGVHAHTRLVVERVSSRPGPHMSVARGGRDPVLEFLALVYDEVARAREKFPSSDGNLTALGEEFGEVAKAMLDESSERVLKEAVQTACMACRVAIEGDPSLDAYRATSGAGHHPPHRTRERTKDEQRARIVKELCRLDKPALHLDARSRIRTASLSRGNGVGRMNSPDRQRRRSVSVDARRPSWRGPFSHFRACSDANGGAVQAVESPRLRASLPVGTSLTQQGGKATNQHDSQSKVCVRRENRNREQRCELSLRSSRQWKQGERGVFPVHPCRITENVRRQSEGGFRCREGLLPRLHTSGRAGFLAIGLALLGCGVDDVKQDTARPAPVEVILRSRCADPTALYWAASQWKRATGLDVHVAEDDGPLTVQCDADDVMPGRLGYVTPEGILTLSSPTDRKTMLHEVGHLLGAGHLPEGETGIMVEHWFVGEPCVSAADLLETCARAACQSFNQTCVSEGESK